MSLQKVRRYGGARRRGRSIASRGAREDATLARAAGCHDLSLFDLGGVLSRARPPGVAPIPFARQRLLETRGSKARPRRAPLARLATWALARKR
jgi:hypothetical protein